MRNKGLHHQSIIDAATAEFLQYGFENASMRRIAAAAGMSASGLYKHFASKEDMFSALVEPACKGLLSLYSCEESNQREAIVGSRDFNMWERGNDAKMAISYIYDHLDAFRLVTCKAQGTKYENFLHDIAVLEEERTLSFMEFLKKQGIRVKEFRVKELHLLTTANINAIFQTVRHDFSREEAIHYGGTLDCFFSNAWKAFFGF